MSKNSFTISDLGSQKCCQSCILQYATQLLFRHARCVCKHTSQRRWGHEPNVSFDRRVHSWTASVGESAPHGSCWRKLAHLRQGLSSEEIALVASSRLLRKCPRLPQSNSLNLQTKTTPLLTSKMCPARPYRQKRRYSRCATRIASCTLILTVSFVAGSVLPLALYTLSRVDKGADRTRTNHVVNT